MTPRPISWPPSQYWDGDLGSWSSFALRVGKPVQTVRVIPSTAGTSTWVITPSGCEGLRGTPSYPLCDDARGGLFNDSHSTSWKALSNNSLGLDDALGFRDKTGQFGLDSITIGFGDFEGGPQLDSQLIAGIAPEWYFNGLFGLNHQATFLENFTEPHPSALTTMKSHNMIPSLSWAYTAGAKYRSPGVFGSLTFGGYDASRFDATNISFALAADVTRDIVVELQTIVSTLANRSTTTLLSSPMLTFIDSTQPFIYLPVEACRAFEHAFRLIWDETDEVYWVDDSMHQDLILTQPSIKFTVADPANTGSVVDITLPYASFDLQATKPAVQNTKRFFPLRRAANESQYTLGRTFLQEAYLIADYERSIFSVSQVKFGSELPKRITAINATNSSPFPRTHRSHKSRNIVIGCSTSAAVLLLCFCVWIAYALSKRRKRKTLATQVETDRAERRPSSQAPEALPITHIQEIDAIDTIVPVSELPNTGKSELQGQEQGSSSIADRSVVGHGLRDTIHELRTHRSSMENLLYDTRPLRRLKMRRSTDMFEVSRFSVDSSEVVTSAETRKSTSNQVSVRSSYFKTEIYSAYMYDPIDLNRSLPPTPISETPMVSPFI